VLKRHPGRLPAEKSFPVRGHGRCQGSGGWPSTAASGGMRKRDPRFPRPRGTVPRRPARPGTTQASARPGGREAPAMGGAGSGRGALGPPAGQGPALRGGKGDGLCQPSGDGAIARPGGIRKRDPRFHRPRGTVPRRPASPGRTEASARPGGREAPAEGGAGAGRGLWAPRRARDQRYAVAKAMAFAMASGSDPSSLRAGQGNATRVSPARAGRSPVDRQVREQRRPAPDPAGEKRPPRAGRALAGGFGPPAGV